jgi:hypothetical protein
LGVAGTRNRTPLEHWPRGPRQRLAKPWSRKRLVRSNRTCSATFPWGCSSTGRAPALQAGGCRFDADRLHHRFVRSVSSVARALPCLGRLSGIRLPHGAPLFAEVAHQVEQLIEDQRVEGSSPSFGTIITGRLAERPIAPGLNPGIEASPRSRVRIPRLPPSSFFGEVPEWSIGARWKRDGRSDAARGSNPRFSSTPFWICARAVKGL